MHRSVSIVAPIRIRRLLGKKAKEGRPYRDGRAILGTASSFLTVRSESNVNQT